MLKLKTILLILALTLGLLYLFHEPILVQTAQFLTVNNPPEQADLIYVLSGGIENRPFHAARLYQQGIAPRIVVSVEAESPPIKMGLLPTTTEVTLAILDELAVPQADIITLDTPGGVTSTFDEAVLLRKYIIQHQPERVIIVTTAFHTRRAQWIFNRQLADLQVEISMVAASHEIFDETNWWRNEDGLITYLNEYIKFAFYLYNYW
ncbi:YdcF family protein [Anaerolineales bacterium HSG24]|nr:YdcF family protein [Anaerolineales bacterium HSG24]